MTRMRQEAHGQRCLVAMVDGPVAVLDIRAVLAIARADRGYGCPELIDLRRAPSNFVAVDLRAFAGWLRDFVAEHAIGPTAVVVSTPVAYGMMRMLESLTDGVCSIRPFMDIHEAREWLLQAGADTPQAPA